MSSDSHTVIFKEQQRQGFSLRERLLGSKGDARKGCALTNEAQTHRV